MHVLMEDALTVQEELNLTLQIAIQEKNLRRSMQLKTFMIQKNRLLTKLDKLLAYGHDASKLELVIVGGTFLFMPKDYQENFIKSCYDALNGFDSSTLQEAKTNNEYFFEFYRLNLEYLAIKT